MEEYKSNESTSWNWIKAVSVGKKLLTAGVVVSSAPLLVPWLFFVATIAILASVPYCLFLATYACTQKLMATLLPDVKETSKKAESEFEYSKPGHDEDTTDVQTEELTSLTEDEPRSDGITFEKDMDKLGNTKSEKLQDQIKKQPVAETGHEEALDQTTSQSVTEKHEKTSSKELIDQAESASHQTGDEKRKNTTKRKKKTGRAGV